MSSHSDDHDPLADAPVVSPDAATPRGGFMARPGLKSPPRHAVVVRVGDVPESEEIPVARASVPPPAPASEPPPVSISDKITLRIPTSSAPPPAVKDVPRAPPPALLESLPPPSDAPVAQSVRGSGSSPLPPRRPSSSRWTIVVAAAAGLLLGLVSVLTTMRSQRRSASAPSLAPTLEAARVPHATKAVPSAAPTASVQPAQALDDGAPTQRAAVPAPPVTRPAVRRSIF